MNEALIRIRNVCCPTIELPLNYVTQIDLFIFVVVRNQKPKLAVENVINDAFGIQIQIQMLTLIVRYFHYY